LSSNFSRSLIGGDIGGLMALASRLRGYPAQIEDVVHTLNHHVEGLVHDASWWGPGADGFKHRWEVDADGAHALGNLLTYVGGVIGQLASTLRQLEGALEQAVADARAAGVPVGPDGEPPILAPGADPAVRTAAATYADEWQVAQDLALRARMDANRRLMEVDGLIAPRPNQNQGHLTPDQWVTDGEYLAGFAEMPEKAKKYLQLRLPKLRAERDAARRKYRTAQQKYGAHHRRIPDEIKAGRKETVQALEDANTDLDRVEKEVRAMKFLNVKVGSVVLKLAPGVAKEAKLFKLFADIPILDIVAVVAGTGFQSADDNQKGQDWGSAVPEALTANVAGVAAGVVVGAAVVGGAVLLGVSAPALLVGAVAVGVGGLVAIGATDLVTEGFHEHWDEDIHKYGVVGGISAGITNVEIKAGKDMVDLGGKTKDMIGGVAMGLWNGVFGKH
jgi:hypothetical protein